ncbi:amidohydrolase family protein, partial [Candidatus Sumerlaeota bacterium]|nr:amidohydrolase family protein [Candidatus Sumerlaeota bacterium]
MWVPKYERDWKKGVDSPMPTQVVSNEEFIPRPQSKQQKQVEHLIGELGTENAKRLGMDRRHFMRTSMGLATVFIASNMVYGPHWDVDAAEALDATATDEKFPKGEYFIIDAQSHFTNGVAIPGFRDNEFVKNMGFQLKSDAEAYSFQNFVKEMLFDSETSMVIISGVPGREKPRDDAGNVLEGAKRGGGVLPSWLMSQRKKDINEMAKSQRALCQGNCAPNHYWDKTTGKPDYPLLFEQMEREYKMYGIDSWKWYCHTDPGRSGGGFQLDDEMAAKFYEKTRELGLRNISVHKGFSYQSRTLGHLANPKDVEKAALNNKDLNFIIYHSALKHGPNEPDYEKLNEYNPETGDFLWHSVLMDVKKRNPQITNVYPEIGSSFGSLAIQHPVMCQHLIGKNIKYFGADHVIWGTDCLWWGSPQWAIDAFKRFQISDELCEKFGYAKVTNEDKKKIFGENIAKLYKIDISAKRNALPKDALTAFK